MTHWQVGAKIYSYRLDQRVRTRTALCNIPPAFSSIHETPNAVCHGLYSEAGFRGTPPEDDLRGLVKVAVSKAAPHLC